MDPQRRNIDGFAAAVMLFLCIIWGLQQTAIKAAAPDIVPIMQVGLRSGISAFFVALVMMATGVSFSPRDGTLRPGLIVGALFAVEFCFIAEGLARTSASHMAVFLYTAPIFTALGLHLTIPAERLTAQQWLGIGVAFCGIVTVFAGGFLRTQVSTTVLFGDFLGILGGAFWAATTIVVRTTTLSEAAPSKTLLYQLVAAFLLILLYCGAVGKFGVVRMSGIAWASLLFQGIVVSFASYLTWFWLLRRYLASRLSAFSFMSPLFGVSFGVLLLHEPVDRYFGIGAALVLTGITLVSTRRAPREQSAVAAVAATD